MELFTEEYKQKINDDITITVQRYSWPDNIIIISSISVIVAHLGYYCYSYS